MGGHIRAPPTASGGNNVVTPAATRHITHQTVCAKGALREMRLRSGERSVHESSHPNTPHREPRELRGDRNPHQAAHSANRSRQGRQKTS